MKFNGSIITEGTRRFIPMPGNAWDELQSKGNIPVSVEIGEIRFECKLIPKGNGAYYVPVKKDIAAKLEGAVDVCVTKIDGLTRINSNSPYSKDKPIRKIDSITPIEFVDGYCGHTVIAMLAGVTVAEVTKLIGRNISWSIILEALDYYGISYAAEQTRHTQTLPYCCVIHNGSGFSLKFGDDIYGNAERIVSYREIIV